MGYLLLFMLVLVGMYYWWDAQGSKEIATAAGRNACLQKSLQFLDESVERSNQWIKENQRGQLCWWRRYEFEFAQVGDRRFNGYVVLLGKQVVSVHLEPYPIIEDPVE